IVSFICTMKFAVVLLLALPLAFARPEKRALFGNLIETDKVRCFLQHLVDLGEADETEQACEATCHDWLSGPDSALIHTFCTPTCRSAQTLIHQLDITPNDPGVSAPPNSLQCPSA
ncbi:hypothetical protein BaRGS_00028565, partial [Batillaria attramentaria]